MRKSARIIYLIVGSVMPIFIGGLHLMVHFKDLVTAEIQGLLSSKAMINGTEQVLWDAWGVMSVMMGVSFIIIGLLNILILSMSRHKITPPKTGLLIMLIYLFGVLYVGVTFVAPMQLYGSMVGIVLSLLGLFLIIKCESKELS